MRKKFINGLLLAALAFTATNTFVSCKDTSADYYAELQGQYNDVTAENAKLSTLLNQQIKDLTAAQNDLQAQLDALKKLEEADKTDIKALKDEVNTLKASIEDLQKKIDALKGGSDCDCKDELEAMQKQLDAMKDEYATKTALQNEIADRKAQDALLEEAINALKKQLAEKADGDIVKQISDVNTAAAAAAAQAEQALKLAGAKADAAQVTALKGTVDALETTVSGWNDELKKVAADASSALAMATANAAKAEVLSNDLDKVKAELAAAKATYDNAIKVINEALASVQKQISELSSTVADLQAAYDTAIENLQNDVKAVEEAIATIKSDVAKTQEDIEALKNKKDISSVVIQGTYNPVIGSIALPFGVKSNILAAFYGQNQMPNSIYTFPTTNVDYYVFADEAISADAKKVLGGSFNGAEKKETEYVMDGNAGKVYLTINPAGEDYTGSTISLVNSLDEESGIVLSSLKPSTEKLNFGWTVWTRSIENGFYEAQATLLPENINQVKPSINKSQLKDIAKEVIGKFKGGSINITDIMFDVQNMASDVLDANGVKVVYGDKTIYSEYALAATAIEPLSFATLKDGINKQLPIISDLGEIDFEVEMDLQYAEVNLDFSDKTYNVGGTTYTIPELNNLLNNIYTELVFDVNYLTDQIKDQVNDQVDDAVDKVNDKAIKNVNKVINKVNSLINRLNGYLKNPNHFFQICLAYDNNEGEFCQMSNSLAFPTTFKFAAGNAISLVPTSYTAEIFAPAFKKYIAVTNVYNADKSASAQEGDATCQALADYANNTDNFFNTVIDGKNTEVVFAPKPGYTDYIYEITYAAVDYNGYNTARKFYVKVK